VTNEKRKRALLLVGAGASIDFGVPSTQKLTNIIANKIANDSWMQRSGADSAFKEIQATLGAYYQGGVEAVNFEQIYHCAHELLFTFSPGESAVNAYRPALFPFLTRRITADENSLIDLKQGIISEAYNVISTACGKPQNSIKSLSNFIENMRSNFLTRIYTTNYDDFILQAAPDLFTGFEAAPSTGPARFQGKDFWNAAAKDCLYHLHGSIHCGFSHSVKTPRWAELFWYRERDEALRNAFYLGTADRRMDGSTVDPTAIITGLDKLSRLQRQPFSYYYSSFNEDVLRADIILIIGYGLGDLHLNSWIREARLYSPRTPIILIDFWPDGFMDSAAYNETDRKLSEIWHELKMALGYEPHRDFHGIPNWTLDYKKSCAVWDNGFKSFLDNQKSFEEVISLLIVN